MNNRAIRTSNLRATAGIVLLAVLLTVALVFALRPTVTTSDRNDEPAIQEIGAGGLDLKDPYIDRHAALIARYHDGGIR